MTRRWGHFLGLGLAAVLLLTASGRAHAAWEPTKPIEFVVPAGTGGGADQMARLIAGIAEKHKLSPRPIIVVNKSGGAGAYVRTRIATNAMRSLMAFSSR